MQFPHPTLDQLDRYLRILGISVKTPNMDALSELVAAHVMRIPFENISKLYFLKHSRVEDLFHLEHFLDDIEQYNFGGTCYTCNYFLNLLLKHLGYDAMLCGADMNNPDVHIVSMVTVDKREYIVDVGYAAPFLVPLPRDLRQDYVITLGQSKYVLKPQDSEGRSRLELYRDGDENHGYIAKPMPRRIDYFSNVIADSFTESSTFMNALLVIRFFPGRSLAVKNLTLVESEGTTSTKKPIPSREELPGVIEKHFGIPSAITSEAISKLDLNKDFRD